MFRAWQQGNRRGEHSGLIFGQVPTPVKSSMSRSRRASRR
jgi:hypothetical protein